MKALGLALVAAALAIPMHGASAQAKKPGKRAVNAAPAVAASAASAAPATTLSPFTDAERAVSQYVYTGKIACELGANVTVTEDASNPGYFHVSTGNRSYHMHPVVSKTGAIRLEDAKAGATWLQLGNKSMLLDQKLGRRVADECAAPTQLEFAARMKDQPPVNLLGVNN